MAASSSFGFASSPQDKRTFSRAFVAHTSFGQTQLRGHDAGSADITVTLGVDLDFMSIVIAHSEFADGDEFK